MKTFHFLLCCCLLSLTSTLWAEPVAVGAAKVDVTPTHPVALAGYGGRTQEHEGVDTKIWARALAIGAKDPAVIIAVDNCGIPASVTRAVAAKLQKGHGVKPANLVLAVTHTHNAPSLRDYAVVVWGGRATPAQKANMNKYTDWLIDRIVEAAASALKARQPASLSWGMGRADFGGNRRIINNDGRWAGFGFQRDGPVDHSLPFLVAKDAAGKPVAIWANYACHCTTLGGRNRICGDWAGFAGEDIEKDHPGSISVVTIGCGADIGPQPSGGMADAKSHGRKIASGVAAVMKKALKPLAGTPAIRQKTIQLPLEKPADRAHWEATAKRNDFHGYQAKLMLEQLEKNGKIQEFVPYTVSTWTFRKDLALVFLPGEVVVDYAVRLKTELDYNRLWINAWCNDMPGYIPSRRVLKEGGYEADFSQVYYALPGRYKPELEDLLITTIRDLLGPDYLAPKGQKPAGFLRIGGK